MSQKRRQVSATEKVSYVRRHLVEKETVSEICDEARVRPTLFYKWQKQLFEKGATLFESGKGRKPQEARLEDRVRVLEQKLQRKHEVLSELMEEHVKLKKSLGEI